MPRLRYLQREGVDDKICMRGETGTGKEEGNNREMKRKGKY